MALEKYQEVRDCCLLHTAATVFISQFSDDILMCICHVPGWFIFSLCSVKACENGRGAILLSVARGKVSEGIDFGKP